MKILDEIKNKLMTEKIDIQSPEKCEFCEELKERFDS